MPQRPDKWALNKFSGWIENQTVRALQKYGEVPISASRGGVAGTVEPPYKRQFDPDWIYRIRRNSALVNNSIEEKVNQTFRRGWGEWEKRYEAKCPNCKEEFGSEADFVEDYHPEDVEIDFDTERRCPNCEEMVELKTPDPETLERAKRFLQRANGKELSGAHLEPDNASSVSQTFLEVLREGSWDLESFDEQWLTFSRSYTYNANGKITDFRLEEAYRAPPERMEYVVDKETGEFGGEYWVCVRCREHNETYTPETEDQPCSDCGGHTYEVFAVAKNDSRGGDIVRYFIRGEFAHRSIYEPSKYYGYSPIVSLWEETRTLEQMDSWYQDAYEQRRAPRGALAIKSSNAKSTREWNKKQFNKLRNDPNHIPTLMDDGETNGDPLTFINLLESPAEMQHMEMREWFKERISAKWGVTPIFQGSPSESGLSQSMEIEVSSRAAGRLRTVQNDLIDVVLRQLGVEGWKVEIAPVEEENEQEEIELQLKHLQAAQQAAALGREVEWTEDNRARIKPGDMEAQEGADGGMGMGGMDGLGELGSDMEETAADQGGPEDQNDFQTATESAGGDRIDLGSPGSGGGL
jgi:hypothetical protein